MKKLILSLTVISIITGCAVCRTKTSKSIDTNKNPVETTSVSIYTLFDGNSSVTKLSTKVSAKTSGTGIGSIDESSSGTNFASSMKSLENIIVAIPK